MKNSVRTALFLLVVSSFVLPALAMADPGGTMPPPDSGSLFSLFLSLLGM